MIKPNFFILGGPKCGTTSLFEYVSTHPRIFMCAQKELNYFSDDVLVEPNHLPEKYYLQMFKAATPDHLVVGEASIFYLYSPLAVKRLLEFNPQSRMIAMVRNPVDMAYSYHSQMLWNTIEDVEDFPEAWRLQAERRAHRHLPKKYRHDDPQLGFLQYADICSLGTQVERLLKTAPHEQVKIILFENFIGDTQRVYEEVLSFLGVPSDGKTSFPRINENKTFKNSGVRILKSRVTYLPHSIRSAADTVKRITGVRDFGILRTINRVVNSQYTLVKRPELDHAFRHELREYFRPQIELLEKILDRDLSHWQ